MASSQSPKATVFNRRSEPAEAPCRLGNAFPASGAAARKCRESTRAEKLSPIHRSETLTTTSRRSET